MTLSRFPYNVRSIYKGKVLIPLLVDDPLQAMITKPTAAPREEVLIPLLVDDPLQVVIIAIGILVIAGLNPSSSG